MKKYLLALVAILVACGSPPDPKEIVDARAAYQHAAQGPAAQLKPADLLTAKQQLDKAEGMLKSDGDVEPTRTAAYVAGRKALLAESLARIAVAEKEKVDAEHGIDSANDDAIKKKDAELANTKQALNQTQSQLGSTQDQLAREKAAREEAEKRAAQAMADLQKIAQSVKKEDRGMVITFSGGVLFKTGAYELQPGAMAQLNQVADALVKNSPDSRITVEGHTDSQGPASVNKELSHKRADAVAQYLVGRGIAADRVTAAGIGSDRPIADNNSIEGRAQNRRVEIIVK